MDLSVTSPLKLFLKNDLFSDVVLHVYKVSSPLSSEEEGVERFKMDGLGDDLDEDGGCMRKKRKYPLFTHSSHSFSFIFTTPH